MESQETHSVSEGPSRCPGSWWKTCFKQPSWVQKKCLIIQDYLGGYIEEKETLNYDADGDHDNEQKDDHDEEHEGRNHLTIAVESHHISVRCCPDDFIHSQTILTWVWPQIITTAPPPKKMDRYSVWVPTKIQCLKLIITVLNHSSQCLYSVRSCFWS